MKYDNTLIEEHYKAHYKKIVKKLSWIAKDKTNAEDIAQEAYSRALKYIHTCSEEKFEAWFGKILANALKNWKNEQYENGMIFEELDEEIEPISVASLGEFAIKRLTVKIDKVFNEEHKEVLQLYFLYGFKPREIVQVSNLKIRNVNIIIERFKKGLYV